MSTRTMHGNRNPDYLFKPGEEKDYHIRLTYRIHIKDEKRYEEEKRDQIVSQRDFQDYKNPKMELQKVLGYTELEILHDPTYTPPGATKTKAAVDPVVAQPKETPVVDPIADAKETITAEENPVKETQADKTTKVKPNRKPNNK